MHDADWQQVRQGEVDFYRIPSFAAFSFVRHGFSTRAGGVSKPPFDAMNLSFSRGDDPAAVTENFRRFCGAVGVSEHDLVLAAQTHGTALHYATEQDRGNGFDRPNPLRQIDGLVTDRPGVVLCTQYADCVPLFFLDPEKRVIALSHAGWRGTAADIAGATVRRMQQQFGCDPRRMLAGIGPSIGPCCFEVDAPVYDVFARSGLPAEGWYRKKGEKYYVDLWQVNQLLLQKAGLTAEHISAARLCTHCRPDVFWSHRTTGPTRGSLAAVLALTEE